MLSLFLYCINVFYYVYECIVINHGRSGSRGTAAVAVPLFSNSSSSITAALTSHLFFFPRC